MAEKEYIEREALIKGLMMYTWRDTDGWEIDDSDAKRAFIEEWLPPIPAADVRPVVTCAECDWHVDCGYHFCNKWCLPCPDNADFYCAYGERPTAGLT